MIGAKRRGDGLHLRSVLVLRFSRVYNWVVAATFGDTALSKVLVEMSAIEEFNGLMERTDVIKQIVKSLKEEPARLLQNICRQYREGGKPVPDHRLRLAGHMGEAALKALIAAGMVRRHPGGGLALYTLEPTAEGLAQCEKLIAEEQGNSPGPT